MTEHTPTPWRAADAVVVVTAEDHGFDTWIANCMVGGNDRATQDANAAFIVNAVNAYESLRTALRTMIDCAEMLGIAGSHDNLLEAKQMTLRALSKAKEALEAAS